ncbi:MAG: winged helix-turn-helix transcriptional regulator, partial [Armatimonadetes bacterium]|nr:winged helix-turn-helix transcriptional regulator [Armatimonadota bacterium]
GRVLKALADPNRRRIMELLAQAEITCEIGINCTRITEQLTVSQPTVSHHMKELAAANLLTMTPHGTASVLSLRRDTLEAVFATLRERFRLPPK